MTENIYMDYLVSVRCPRSKLVQIPVLLAVLILPKESFPAATEARSPSCTVTISTPYFTQKHQQGSRSTEGRRSTTMKVCGWLVFLSAWKVRCSL